MFDRNIFRLSLLTSILVSMISCATVSQKIAIGPIDTTFPVSASRSLVVDSRVVMDSELKEREPFLVSRVIQKPIGNKEIDFGLKSIVESQISGSKYKGITQLKIEVKDVNNSTATFVAYERNLAMYTAGIGLLYFSYTSSLPAKNGGGDYGPGIGIMAVAAGLLGGSYLHESLGTIDYKIDVSGLKIIY